MFCIYHSITGEEIKLHKKESIKIPFIFIFSLCLAYVTVKFLGSNIYYMSTKKFFNEIIFL